MHQYLICSIDTRIKTLCIAIHGCITVLSHLYYVASQECYLGDANSKVIVVGDTYSPCSAVTSEVPQGSVLGPVVFLLYINDITTNIHSQLCLFADDCLVYRLINSSNPPE